LKDFIGALGAINGTTPPDDKNLPIAKNALQSETCHQTSFRKLLSLLLMGAKQRPLLFLITPDFPIHIKRSLIQHLFLLKKEKQSPNALFYSLD
jgi:hypothetical protein